MTTRPLLLFMTASISTHLAFALGHRLFFWPGRRVTTGDHNYKEEDEEDFFDPVFQDQIFKEKESEEKEAELREAKLLFKLLHSTSRELMLKTRKEVKEDKEEESFKLPHQVYALFESVMLP